MRFTTALGGALFALTSLTDALSIPDIQAKRQTTTTVVTGVQDDSVSQRLELRQLESQNPDQFNLYLLGLQAFMKVDQSDPLSYYQIAGIHGRPYSPWEDWTSAAGSSGYGGGYCTHVSNIFLTWHRPYLALFEQQLYQHIQTVANSFPSSDLARWQAAAENFRIPYWDWAVVPSCSNCEIFPKLVSKQFISVTTPSGQKTIQNPLFRYNFHPISASDMVYSPFASWGVTKRYPTNWTDTAVSQNNLVTQLMIQNQPSLKSRLYNLFTNYNNFTEFSNEAWEASSGIANADSIESVHDAIHSITGSNGHMTYLDYSAFDPIFWLHHANVDRLWTMWSTIYPDSYVTSAAAQGSTYTYPAGTTIDENFGLIPWMKNTSRTLYSSLDVISPSTFGYSYPETANNATAADVKSSVNSLYGSSSSSSSKRDLQARGTDIQYEYIVNIVSQKFQMNGSYGVYVFLGDPGSDASQWPTSSNLVGMHGVAANLADAENSGMSNMDLPITGTVPLTYSLQAKVTSGDLSSMAPAVVEPYLQQNLEWRVSMFDGTYVPVTDVPDFSVAVVVSELQPAASADEFPTWGTFASMANATTGKAGADVNVSWWGSEQDWSLTDLADVGIDINVTISI